MIISILGGGLAGLSAAYHLNKHGIKPDLIEKETELGDLARTISFNGFRLDFGPHRFHTEKRWILDIVKDLLGDDLLIRQRISRILFNGKYIDYTLKPNAILSMDNKTILRVVRDYIAMKVKNTFISSRENSFSEWVTNRFGHELI